MNYALWMILAFVSAAVVAWLLPGKSPLSRGQQAFLALAGSIGAILAAKAPFILLDESLLHHTGTIMLSGKTILLGLVGGYAGVELAKAWLNIKLKTGDRFAVPVATGIGIGRLGCFFAGCCYGVPASVPWGVVFPTADHAARHPTQLYESAFHLTMAAAMYVMLRNGVFRNQLIKFYFLSYFVFRFLTEFLRPEIRWAGGLTAYQWAILVLIPVFAWLWVRDSSGQPGTK